MKGISKLQFRQFEGVNVKLNFNTGQDDTDHFRQFRILTFLMAHEPGKQIRIITGQQTLKYFLLLFIKIVERFLNKRQKQYV